MVLLCFPSFPAFVTSLGPMIYSAWCKSAPGVLLFTQDARCACLPQCAVHTFRRLQRVLRAGDITHCKYDDMTTFACGKQYLGETICDFRRDSASQGGKHKSCVPGTYQQYHVYVCVHVDVIYIYIDMYVCAQIHIYMLSLYIDSSIL